MANNLVLPSTIAASIPGDEFQLSVKVHTGGNCGTPVPAKLKALETTGIKTSLVTLLTQATIFYKNRTIKLRANESDTDARLRRQWQDLEDFDPRVLSGPDQIRRLIISTPKNGEESNPVSKILGEAVALHVAQEVSGVEYRRWAPRTYQKGVRHDLEATGTSGLVLAEARGRFNGNNLNAAIKGVESKFKAQFKGQPSPTRTQAIGVVYCLRDNPDNGKVNFTHDVVIADPAAEGRPPIAVDRWRSLVVHYVLVFRRQGLHGAADRLARLLRFGDRELHVMVSQRVQIAPLAVFGEAPQSLWGRTTMLVPTTDGAPEPYVGTFFDNLSNFRPHRESGNGVFFGLHIRVANALALSRIDDLDTMSAASWVGSVDGYDYVRPDDGTVFIRPSAPGISLLDHP